MEKIKNKTLVLILILISAFIIILFLNAPLQKQTIPTKFTAGENMGFDLTPDSLNFGKIVPGSSATRNITITNTFDKPTITKIKSSGEISSHIIVSENNFILQPEESKNITFTVYSTKNLEYKEYPGKIVITTKRTTFFS